MQALLTRQNAQISLFLSFFFFLIPNPYHHNRSAQIIHCFASWPSRDYMVQREDHIHSHVLCIGIESEDAHTHTHTHTGITAGRGDDFEKITLHFTLSFPFTFIKVCRDLNHCTQQNGNLKLSAENRTLKTEWSCLLDDIIKLLKQNTWTHQFLDLFWGNKSQLFVSPLVSLLWQKSS